MKSKFEQQNYVSLKLRGSFGTTLVAKAWKDECSSKVRCIYEAFLVTQTPKAY